MSRNRLRFVMSAARGTLLAMLAAANAHAQAPTTPPPDVRQQGEQQERFQRDREEARRRQLQASPNELTPPTFDQRRPWPELEAPCRAIHEVALVGDSSESFQWALADLIAGPDPAIGRCLGVAGVNVAAERAQQALIERGFVTSRIVFEAQNLSSGRLTLSLLPGRIRAIRFATPDDRATAWNAMNAKNEVVWQVRRIENPTHMPWDQLHEMAKRLRREGRIDGAYTEQGYLDPFTSLGMDEHGAVEPEPEGVWRPGCVVYLLTRWWSYVLDPETGVATCTGDQVK
jgi:hypothetical protein